MSGTARQLNMMEGSLWDKILKYALPLAATGILQQLFNAADIAVVGNFTGELGPAAMAAVGASGPLVGLIVFFVAGISLGTNVVVANYVGMGNSAGIKKAVHTSILFSVLTGAVVAAASQFFAVAIFVSQNVPEEVLPMAVLYFRIYLAGLPVILLYNFESAVFRGIGNTHTPLIALVISGVLNVLLNLFFVIVLHRTADGVAIATVISNLISAVILFIWLLRSDGPAHVEWKSLRIDKDILKRILQIGLPAGIQGAVFSISNIVVQSAINSLGTIIMAASSAALNVEILVYNLLNSFSQACTTFVGQNYGAGQPDRCKKTLGLCLLEGFIAMGLGILLVLSFGRQMLGFFNSDPQVIEVGYQRLVIIFVAYIFTITYEVLAGYMRGFGISLTPAVLTIFGICVVRIAWIALVFPKEPTYRMIIMAYPVSLATTAGLMFVALMVMRPAGKRGRKLQG